MEDTFTPQPEQKGSGALKLVLLGCGGCLFLGLTLVVLLGGLVHVATKDAAAAAHRHVALVKEGQARQAYELTSQGFREATTYEAFAAFVEGHPELYAGADLTLNERQVNGAQATMRGHTTSAAGERAPVVFHLVKDGEVWRVHEVSLAPP